MDCPRKRRMDLVRHRSRKLGDIVNTLKELGDGETWKPFGVSNFVELLEDPERARRVLQQHLPARRHKSIVEFWQKQQADGVAHITVNLKPTARRAGNHSGFRRKRDTAFCGVRFGVSGCLKC